MAISYEPQWLKCGNIQGDIFSAKIYITISLCTPPILYIMVNYIDNLEINCAFWVRNLLKGTNERGKNKKQKHACKKVKPFPILCNYNTIIMCVWGIPASELLGEMCKGVLIFAWFCGISTGEVLLTCLHGNWSKKSIRVTKSIEIIQEMSMGKPVIFRDRRSVSVSVPLWNKRYHRTRPPSCVT